jgi:hypothetical protein
LPRHRRLRHQVGFNPATSRVARRRTQPPPSNTHSSLGSRVRLRNHESGHSIETAMTITSIGHVATDPVEQVLQLQLQLGQCRVQRSRGGLLRSAESHRDRRRLRIARRRHDSFDLPRRLDTARRRSNSGFGDGGNCRDVIQLARKDDMTAELPSKDGKVEDRDAVRGYTTACWPTIPRASRLASRRAVGVPVLP